MINNEDATVSPNKPDVGQPVKHVNDNEDIKKMKEKTLQKQVNELSSSAAWKETKEIREVTKADRGSEDEHKMRSSYKTLDRTRGGKVRQRLPVRNNNNGWQSSQEMEQGANNAIQQSPAKRALQTYNNHHDSHQLIYAGKVPQEKTLPKFSQSAYPVLIYEDNPSLLVKKKMHYVNPASATSTMPTYTKISHSIVGIRDSDKMHDRLSYMPEQGTTSAIRNEHRQQTTPTPSSTLAEEDTTATSTSRPRQTARTLR